MHRPACQGVTAGCAHGLPGQARQQQQARRLRRTGLPLAEIAATLGVSKSSVSLWVRDVEFTPLPRPPRGRRRAPNALQRRKQAEVDRLVEEGRARVGRLSEREFLVAGVALYAGEGAKRRRSSEVRQQRSSDDRRSSAPGFGGSSRSTRHACGCGSICTKGWIWPARSTYWSALTGIPTSQFLKPYRAVAGPTIRHTKHVHGCVTSATVAASTHRSIMGLVGALLGDAAIPG